MKKLFLMDSLIFAANLCSAQFMAITTINQPGENEEWEMSNFTDNIGIAYGVKENIVVGLVKSGDEYDVWGRYYFSNCYASLQVPTEESTDNMTLGVGYSFHVWNRLYIDPSYAVSTKEDSQGEFKIGVSYRIY